MVEIVHSVPEKAWKSFLEECDDATLYHTPEWKTFLERTFGYVPHYLFATDECGELVGFLPLFIIRSRLTGDRLCSVPFSHECGCLGEPLVRDVLLDKAVEISKRCRVGKIEFRNCVNHEDFHCVHGFSTYILDLTADPKDTWRQLHKGARRAIRKAERFGVTVTTSADLEDLKAFYEINRLNKQDIGVPCHPWKFFKNLFSICGEYVRLYLSHHENTTIAGGIMDCYKDRIVYGYGAADPASLRVHPYYAFIWKSIEDGCLQGYRSYDFGRASNENEGLNQFKRRWGTRHEQLCYSVSPDSAGLSLPSRETALYRFGNTVIQQMPMPVYSKFSDMVFRHLG